MFDQYMCYCNNADGTLGKSISDAGTKIPQVESSIAEGSAMKKQLEADHKAAQVSRVEAKDAIGKAEAIRSKDAKTYAKMKNDFADATSDENSAIASSEGLVASKTKEIEALTKKIESQTARIGALGVKLAQQANDLEDTQEGLAEDQKFLADLDTNCATKKADWAAYKKMEATEAVALADTIKLLNSDDALELFKKALPAGASSFMQLTVASG